ARGISTAEWNALNNDPMDPFVNKAVSGAYNPGSVFKIATALAAMEHGIDPTRRYRCTGHLDVGEDRFHCWKRGGHGWMDLETALIESCDVYFYEVSQLIGIDNIAKTAKKLGLGQLLDFDLPVQTEGVVPTKDWKFGTLGHKWKRGETLVCSIGQGFVQTTPLQNAVMQARVLNGGYAVTPRLMRMIVDEDGNPVEEEQLNFEKLDIDPVHMEFLKRGTDGVTMDERGTARGSRILEPGMSMGGKTGTAQVRRITLAERATGVRTNEELPWKERDHALFVGYGPIEKPRYVVSVFVEHGGGGSSVAAPIARDIMAETLRLDPSGIKGSRNLAEAANLGEIPMTVERTGQRNSPQRNAGTAGASRPATSGRTENDQ
ncbi:MAG: penicillin-binding transpeptidase domain-containing protein, partial [Pseudomonadota bacterium]